VHLAVLEASRAMVVERLSGTRRVSTRHRPGALLPLHCTAIGKALLGYASEDVVRDVMAALTQHTPFTITDPRVLSRQLAEVRRTGVLAAAGAIAEAQCCSLALVRILLTDVLGVVTARDFAAVPPDVSQHRIEIAWPEMWCSTARVVGELTEEHRSVE
jgi:DNA-binding IclR family transcriptional regulator